jgi:hypothetical protein
VKIPQTNEGVPYHEIEHRELDPTTYVPIFFLDDSLNVLIGELIGWNNYLAIIDTAESRYYVQHEHVFF